MEQKKDLSIFSYEGREVRSIIDENGEPWFVAHDVSYILGYSQSNKMMERLRDKDRSTSVLEVELSDGRKTTREMTIINESGLYRAIMGSKKEGAEQFQDWVTDEVLPSIRKTGGYRLKPMTALEEARLRVILLEDIERKESEIAVINNHLEFFSDKVIAPNIKTVFDVIESAEDEKTVENIARDPFERKDTWDYTSGKKCCKRK